MKHLFSWLWNGENVGKRLALGIGAVAAYVVGAGWRPDDPTYWAAGVVVAMAAAASKPSTSKT